VFGHKRGLVTEDDSGRLDTVFAFKVRCGVVAELVGVPPMIFTPCFERVPGGPVRLAVVRLGVLQERGGEFHNGKIIPIEWSGPRQPFGDNAVIVALDVRAVRSPEMHTASVEDDVGLPGGLVDFEGGG